MSFANTRASTPSTPIPLDARKTVVGIGKAKKFMIGPGRGLPVRAVADPAARRCLLGYCVKNGITQRMLEKKYYQYQDVIEGKFHHDGMKKKWYDFSLDTITEIFDGHRVEMVAYVVLMHAFLKEYPGLPPHDGKDPRGISFARYIIWSCELCLLKDYEMIDMFFKCLLQTTSVDPSYFLNMGMLRALMEAVHRDYRRDKFLKFLVENMIEHKNEGVKVRRAVARSFSFFFYEEEEEPFFGEGAHPRCLLSHTHTRARLTSFSPSLA